MKKEINTFNEFLNEFEKHCKNLNWRFVKTKKGKKIRCKIKDISFCPITALFYEKHGKYIPLSNVYDAGYNLNMNGDYLITGIITAADDTFDNSIGPILLEYGDKYDFRIWRKKILDICGMWD